MPKIADQLLHVLATAAHRLLKLGWFVRRPKTFGAHGVALTAEGRLVLVRLRYAEGWRLPGGGRKEGETAIQAALRELREEIGMQSHGEVKLACQLEENTDFKRDTAAIVIVRDVHYDPPRWSLEVEDIREADPACLPADLSPLTARWLAAIRPHL